MGDLLAHPMLCFDFGEDGRVVLSGETRREVGEPFSAFGGFYKMFVLRADADTSGFQAARGGRRPPDEGRAG